MKNTKIYGVYWLAFNCNLVDTINSLKDLPYSVEINKLAKYFYTKKAIPSTVNQVIGILTRYRK